MQLGGCKHWRLGNNFEPGQHAVSQYRYLTLNRLLHSNFDVYWRIHLQSLEKNREQQAPRKFPRLWSGPQTGSKGHMQHDGDEPQDHRGEPLLHLTGERIRRRPDGDEQSEGVLQTGKKQKVQPAGLANQCRDVLIEWLRQKAADEAFRPGDDAELVNSAIEHIKSTVLQPKTNNYGMPARFQQAIGGTDDPPTELMGVVRSSAAGS